ncbi:iron chelate uptake ABC transporter family permease subunit [Massilia sp. BSC265]|uniref:iron chelate uptake ABC transporter family permease subunit n=1 Tax=Massilia sp. BSC265 TaxID=1549812 RepID=UPI0004E9475B|nr:iron chelate uptake ABC transporter family permease subunit [Massilia sp. BSC265]KFI08889.1 enterobactin ABC transporter permease [Massilia sp. BSC265]
MVKHETSLNGRARPTAHIPLLTGPQLCLAAMAAIAAVCAYLFMTAGASESSVFILELRARKLATLLLVGGAIGMSTVLFQTATGNRILTPGLMGFDSLYLLIHTCIAFAWGRTVSAALDARWLFVVQVAVMMLISVLLYRVLFSAGRRSLHQLVLAGVVIGLLFRSLSSFIERILQPSEFAFLQDRFFASFNHPDRGVLGMAIIASVLAMACVVRLARACDVLALGRDIAVNLGAGYQRLVSHILVLVAALVSVSTALVGPVTFFGLLVAHLSYQLMPTHRHALLLPASALLGFICLTFGQIVLEHVFAFGASLRVVVEFLGGLTLLVLLIRGATR